MLLHSLANVCLSTGQIDSSDPQILSYSLSNMTSGTLFEPRSWPIALPSLFWREPSLPNIADSSAPDSSNDSYTPNISPPPLEVHPTLALQDGLRERKATPKTKFVLAHPPPSKRSKQRLNIRPRMIFQLQRVSDSSRALPAFDVISLAACNHCFTRSISRKMTGERVLSMDDLVLLRSEIYGHNSIVEGDITDESEDEITRRHPDLLGAIAYARKAKNGSTNHDEIYLENGLVWEAICLKVGVYEFSAKNHDSYKLRWVSRKARRPHSKENTPTENDNKPSSSRFTFSIINPNTRIHPVIATLTTDNKLDILDRYLTAGSPASPSALSSKSQSPVHSDFSSETSYFDRPATSEAIYTETDEALQILIILTGIWVISKQGWSEGLSKGPDLIDKSRRESGDRSPSSVVSSTENIFKGSSQHKVAPFRNQRSSTSPSPRRAGKQPALSDRANSMGALGIRTATASVPPTVNGGVLLPPSAHHSYQQHTERCKPTLGMEAHGQTPGFASGGFGDATNAQNSLSSMEINATLQDGAKALPLVVDENVHGGGSEEREAPYQDEEKGGLKKRPIKFVRFRAARRSLVDCCIRFF